MWTAGLVLLAGAAWRVLGLPRPIGRRPAVLGLILGLVWGAAIAWVQLRLTWELVGRRGVRPAGGAPVELLTAAAAMGAARACRRSTWAGPPRRRSSGPARGRPPGEACVYIGVVPLILALVGLAAARRDRPLRPWLVVAILTLALATMPGWWPDAFYYVLKVPGLGWFRAPARYTLLTSLGLVLLAARGLDLGRSVSPRRFWTGLALAVALGGLAVFTSLGLAGDAEYRAALGAGTIAARFAGTGLAWALGLATIVAWRRGRLGTWAPWHWPGWSCRCCSSSGRSGGIARCRCRARAPSYAGWPTSRAWAWWPVAC